MTDQQNPPSRSQTIAAALEASRLAERDQVVARLEGISLRTDPAAPLDQRFLAAELAYARGEYVQGIAQFEAFERDARSLAAPAWQRFSSSHRRAFSYLHLGYDEQAEAILREAEERLRDIPESERRLGELDAMHGHLLEHQGDYERARMRFFDAYERSVEREHWRRAETAAGDVAMTYLRTGQLRDAKEWLDRSDEARRLGGHRTPSPTTLGRRGHIRRIEGKHAEAERLYTEAIAAAGDKFPDALEAACRGRAEARLAIGDFQRAEADLRGAITICDRLDNRDHAAYAYRDLAHLFLERQGPGDEELAVRAFGTALRLVLTLRPPQPAAVMDFAEEVLRRPALIGGKPRALVAEPLRDQLAQLRDLVRPHPFAQTARAREAKIAFEALFATFTCVALGLLHLRHRTINLLSGAMIPPPSSGRLRLAPGEFEVLKILVAHPDGVTIEKIAETLGVSQDAGTKRVMRLKVLLTPDLKASRDGNTRLYSLRLAE